MTSSPVFNANTSLSPLRVQDGKIVNATGEAVRLRGFNLGGWLNMEDFITGFTGAEHNLRQTMARILGKGKADFFFERLLDHFFTEEDAAYMHSLGANVLRLPFNYRHFERDQAPFEYLEAGFQRLDRAIEWCGQHGIYVVLDFHAVQGWHNPDWHSDNANVIIQLYDQPHFQERFIRLWAALAQRYKGCPAIAGFSLLNEPLTRMEYERYEPSYYDWEALNGVHRRATAAIREIDPQRIVILEGDEFATRFDGLDVEFAPDIIVGAHYYTTPTIAAGPYPGEFDGIFWNRDVLATEFGMHSGTRLAFEKRLPVFAGEFGVLYTDRPEDVEHRARALDDQLGIFDSTGVHWAIWTYKDIGAMGALNVDPDCEYLRLIRPVMAAKHQVADWEMEMPVAPVGIKLKELADTVDAELQRLGLPVSIERQRFAQFSLFGYLAQLLQVPYAGLFKGLPEEKIDDLLSAFAFKKCRPNAAVTNVLQKHLAPEAANGVNK